MLDDRSIFIQYSIEDPRFIQYSIEDPRFIQDTIEDPRFIQDTIEDPRFIQDPKKIQCLSKIQRRYNIYPRSYRVWIKS
jgi:hypothetical protein